MRFRYDFKSSLMFAHYERRPTDEMVETDSIHGFQFLDHSDGPSCECPIYRRIVSTCRDIGLLPHFHSHVRCDLGFRGLGWREKYLGAGY